MGWMLIALWLYSRGFESRSEGNLLLGSIAAACAIGTRRGQFGVALIVGVVVAWLVSRPATPGAPQPAPGPDTSFGRVRMAAARRSRHPQLPAGGEAARASVFPWHCGTARFALASFQVEGAMVRVLQRQTPQSAEAEPMPCTCGLAVTPPSRARLNGSASLPGRRRARCASPASQRARAVRKRGVLGPPTSCTARSITGAARRWGPRWATSSDE